MVLITEQLVRKKSEHNELEICTLEELSLHQEDIEKIEHLQDWCKNLQILLLQANLISKIENLHRLKNLQYLNLALNNIEVIENLERCESLNKLDLTLNFIGDLESVKNLTNNIYLRDLYLTGNPCTDFEHYRSYVCACLPQLTRLDNIEITRSEQIKGAQILQAIEPAIRRAQHDHAKFREEQKRRQLKNKADAENVDDETFWKSTSEHCPETRLEMSKRSRRARGKDDDGSEQRNKAMKSVRCFATDGRPLNVNQAKVNFQFCDQDPKEFVLDVAIFKYLDTSLVDVDVQPIFVKITIKGKVFQFVLPEEVYTDRSSAQRSQTTGHLIIRMPRVNVKMPLRTTNNTKPQKVVRVIPEREIGNKTSVYLEVTGVKHKVDFANIVRDSKTNKGNEENKVDFIDDPEVPPLE